MPHKRLAVFVIALLILTLACGGVGAVNNPTSLPTQPSGKDNAGPTPPPPVQPHVELVRSWECEGVYDSGEAYFKGAWVVQGQPQNYFGGGKMVYTAIGADGTVLAEEEFDFFFANGASMLVHEHFSPLTGQGSRIVATEYRVIDVESQPHRQLNIFDKLSVRILATFDNQIGSGISLFLEIANGSDFAIDVYSISGVILDGQGKVNSIAAGYLLDENDNINLFGGDSQIPYDTSRIAAFASQLGSMGCGGTPETLFYWVIVTTANEEEFFIITNWPNGINVNSIPAHWP